MDIATGVMVLSIQIVDGIIALYKSVDLGLFNLFDFSIAIIIISMFISVLVRSAKA